jgi:phosphoribosylaminoimidazole-succinocarboxamide synthase
LVEYCYKDDSLGDPLVSEEHIAAFGWASHQEMDEILSLALRVNDFLSGIFYGVGIRLVDFKIEIGRIFEADFQRLVVADEISPDSCRLWDVETGKKLDKDVFRKDLGNLTDAYTEVAMRLGVIQPSNSPPPVARAIK